MIAEGGFYVDGSWLLSIQIESLNIQRRIRVHGDWSIGRVLVNLTNDLPPPPKPTVLHGSISLGMCDESVGWSSYALWWPAKRRWILQTHTSLDQYGLQADACLNLICIRGSVQVQLPDLQIRFFSDVNFTEPLFRVLILICKHLGIQHPEEISFKNSELLSSLSKSEFSKVNSLPSSTKSLHHFKKSQTLRTKEEQNIPKFCIQPNSKENIANVCESKSNLPQVRRTALHGPPRVRNRPVSEYIPKSTNFNKCKSLTLTKNTFEDQTLIKSPYLSTKDLFESGKVVVFQNFTQRVRFSSLWLELGRSLVEQGLFPVDNLSTLNENTITNTGHNSNEKENKCATRLQLRFKYNIFYDLSGENNHSRINQLYEQARWSVITEAIECTNEEAALLAALQLKLHFSADNMDEKLSNYFNLYSDLKNGLSDINKSVYRAPAHGQHIGSTYCLSETSVSLSRSAANPKRNSMANFEHLDNEIDSLLEDLTSNCLRTRTLSPTMRSVNNRSKNLDHYFPSAHRAKLVSEEESSRNQSENVDPTTTVPTLACYIKICQPRMFGLKVFKQVYGVLEKNDLNIYKTFEDYQLKQPPIEKIELLACESYPSICPSSDRFDVKIFFHVSRTNLPISTALSPKNPTDTRFTERLKRRASLLSLTSIGGVGSLCKSAVSHVSGLLSELIIRLPDKLTYVNWSSAVRIAGGMSSSVPSQSIKGETLSKLYDTERQATASLLELLTPISSGAFSEAGEVNNCPTNLAEWCHKNFSDLFPFRLGRDFEKPDNTLAKLNELRSKETPMRTKENLINHVIDIYQRLPTMNPVNIKLQYITRWQQLSGNGIIYYRARFKTRMSLETALGEPNRDKIWQINRMASSSTTLSSNPNPQLTISSSKHDEVVGIGNGRIARHDQVTGELNASWRLELIQGWHVNRQLNELVLILSPKVNNLDPVTKPFNSPIVFNGGRVIIQPLDVSVFKLAEVIGANVFLNLRSPTKSQNLDEILFYKLIGSGPGVGVPCQDNSYC